MNEAGWTLNDEDWERTQYEDQDIRDTAEGSANVLTGRDASGVVTVEVMSDGDVVAVRLASGWKGSVEPHSLNSVVLEAANAATAQALSQKMEGFDPEAAVAGSSVRSESAEPTADESHITSEDAMRLLDAVTADLNDFMRQVSAVADQPTHVDSSGGHVTASGQRGQLLSVEINPQWAGSARESEIEAEITEALKRVNKKSSLGELANGPQSRNIAELNALVRDPQALMRRVGLTPGHRPNDKGE
ncbi:hypothetical protein [Actinopolyspora lacussalsi]|uniref:hypothetical protein n=1 Tax=Actinopolyspora righensis TaxID=995060 RepID=UPI0011143583|nr:hypothetical protein [Actinopolyspora righensis]